MKFELPTLNDVMKAVGEQESILKFTESCLRLSKDMQVWPPSKEIVKQELILASNCVTVHLAAKASSQHDRGLSFSQIQQLICQSLERAYRCISKTSCLSSNSWRAKGITEQMLKIVEAVKDPITHFRSLDMMAQVVTVCGLACLFVKAQEHSYVRIKKTFAVFQELTNMLCKDIMEELVQYKNGQFAETLPHARNTAELPCVRDFIRLILGPCPSSARDVPVAFKPWQLLDTAVHCKQLMRNQDYITAMGHLEATLNTQLEPEIKSIVLCMFGECYLHQGCSQLSLQTYKAALKADRNNHMVFFHLAGVYRTLQQADLELECLNILVRFLTDKHLRSEADVRLDVHLDALVFSVWDVAPSIALPSALHHFARRCAGLERYTEASEQYTTVLKLLEEDPDCACEAKLGVGGFLDVQEVVVEAAEVASLAQQRDHCLALFDQFFPVLSEKDAVFRSSSMPFGDDASLGDSLADSSQDILFSQHLSGGAHHQATCFDGASQVVPSVTEDPGGSRSFWDASSSEPFKNLCDLTRRKRQRSASVDSECGAEVKTEEEEEERKRQGHFCASAHVKDPWRPSSLAVRLLLSKVDVLVSSEGYTEEVMVCLQRAQGLLLDDQTPIFKQPSPNNVAVAPVDDAHKPPSRKRRKFSAQHQAPTTSATSDSGNNDICPTQTLAAGQYYVSELWARTMTSVADRMLKASLSRGQLLSALNSAKLLLQLVPNHKAAQHTLDQHMATKKVDQNVTNARRESIAAPPAL